MHKGVGALFNPTLSAEGKDLAKQVAVKKIDYFVSELLGGGKKAFLNGNSLSAADIYAYVVLSWTGFLKIPMSAAAQAYHDGIKAHDGVKKAHEAMAARA